MKGLHVAPDIDYERLIEATEGYSGADLANVCRDASMMPLRERIARGNVDMDRLHEVQSEVLNVAVTMQDILKALGNVSRSVSQSQLTEYAEWMAEFGSV